MEKVGEYVKLGRYDEKDEDHGKYGFSWPQRNYRCSFCKREFKSAQALGGHMNVHRRERAKMRLLLPLGSDHYINPNPNPNPNPNSFPSSSSCSTKFLPQLNGFSPQTPPVAEGEKVSILVVRSPATPPGRLLTEGRDFQFLMAKGKNDSILGRKKKEIVSFNGLKLSFLRDAKDDLDLELRLGYSN